MGITSLLRWIGVALCLGFLGEGLHAAELGPSALHYAGYASLVLVLVSLLGWNRLLSRRVATRAAALHRAREESEDARDRLVATLEAIPDLLFELDADGRYLEVYATRDALLAAPREVLSGRHLAEVLPPEAARITAEALAAAMHSGSDYGRTIMLELGDGPHWFELSVRRKGEASGTAPTFIVLSRDITTRKLAEMELALYRDSLEAQVARRTADLAAANEEQKAILDSATSGIVLIVDRVLVRCNRKLHDMFGWPQGEMVGKSTHIWYADEAAWCAGGGEVYEQIWRGEIHRREQLLMRRDSSLFWARLTAHAVDMKDRSRGSVWIIDDIDTERAATDAMRRAMALARGGRADEVGLSGQHEP